MGKVGHAVVAESSRAVALVTGAGRGIGLGIARALGLSGMKVALADLDVDSAARSATELRTEGCEAWDVPLDVTEAEGWARALDALTVRWGGLDVLGSCGWG
jgi:NAD(P)-dependent dehydrogenase (short-subunit alcohol dehydrogenase family)